MNSRKNPESDSFNKAEAELLGQHATSIAPGINTLGADIQSSLTESELRTERDTQEVLRKILSLTLEKIPLEEKLSRVLELLFNIPWFALERKGSVFLCDENTNSLRLVAKKYLAPILKDKCANVAFGNCLCGKAAASKKLVFHNHVNNEHETRFDGMPDHGHYCQPIISAKGLVGVLNIYVSAGHIAKPIEVPFLNSVADTLAGLIELDKAKMAQQRLITLLDATPDLVTITDREGKFLYCNNGAKHILGESHDIEHQSVSGLYPNAVARLLLDVAYPYAMKEGIWEDEIILSRPDGSKVPVSQLVIAHRNEPGGEVAYFSTVARDISDRKMAEIAAQTAELRERNFANTLINSMPSIFFLIDVNGRLMRWNSNLEQALGYAGNQLHKMTLLQLVRDEDGPKIEKFRNDTRAMGTASVEVNLFKPDGSCTPFFINGMRLDGSETDVSIVATGIDISYRHDLERELREHATIDVLTGAFNRRKMEEEIENEIKKQVRNPTPLSFAMFDIDFFKRVNDTHGHDVGDIVLKQVTTVTRKQLRDNDVLARWGGEEFLILSSLTTLDGMKIVAERVRKAIEQCHIDMVGNVTVSMGIGEYHAGESKNDLLKRIDDALYLAKNSGRNRIMTSDYSSK